MLRRALVCIVLLSAPGLAATPGFLLGINYTEWGPYFSATQQIAADSSGDLYILSSCTGTDDSLSCLTKLASNGSTVLWQNSLGFNAAAMAVDPNGGIYLINGCPLGPVLTSYDIFVEKLSADGTSVSWNTQLGSSYCGSPFSLAVDATGRAFITIVSLFDSTVPNGTCLVRLSTAGAIDATFTNFPGQPAAVAVDPTGSYVVMTGAGNPYYFFARLAPDNTSWATFSPPLGTFSPGIAVAPNGDAIIYGSDLGGNRSLQRTAPSGAVVFSMPVSSQGPYSQSNEQGVGGLALDAAGNAYIIGYTGAVATRVENSLAPCGSTWLSVYAPDGSILQTTYLPGATGTGPSYGLVALGGSAVFVLDEADTAFTPSQTGPFPQFPYGADYGSGALLNLSPNANAQTLPLACVGSAAVLTTGAIAPGELVALFGNTLGPAKGIATGATPQSPYPTQAGGVEVTFDGISAPLLWAQESQINVAVPWSVAGQTTRICVTYNSVTTNCLTWPVTSTAPGIFTVDGVHAAALNQDGTVNSASNPAPQNSIVSIFATGLGPISPPQSDGSLVGSPLPVNTYPVILEQPCTPVIITGFFPCLTTLTFPTAYAGPAALQIAGMSRIDFNSTDAISDGPVASSLDLVVQTPSGSVDSNSFQIYVAAPPTVRMPPGIRR